MHRSFTLIASMGLAIIVFVTAGFYAILVPVIGGLVIARCNG